MVEPSLDSKIRAIPGIQAIVVTPGSSNREKAVAVIAGKLGISPDAVEDDNGGVHHQRRAEQGDHELAHGFLWMLLK